MYEKTPEHQTVITHSIEKKVCTEPSFGWVFRIEIHLFPYMLYTWSSHNETELNQIGERLVKSIVFFFFHENILFSKLSIVDSNPLRTWSLTICWFLNDLDWNIILFFPNNPNGFYCHASKKKYSLLYIELFME